MCTCAAATRASSIRSTSPYAMSSADLAQHLRIVAQLLDRLGVVGRLVVDRGRPGRQPRHRMGEEPQARGGHGPERVARAQGGGKQDQSLDVGALVGGDQRHRAAHAFARQVDGHVGIPGVQQPGHGQGVTGQGVGPRPAPARRARAEAALVVGVGRDAVPGPDPGRLLPRIAIVAEAVQAQDDRPRRPVGGRPDGDRQRRAVGRDVTLVGQGRRPGRGRPGAGGRGDRGCAGGKNDQGSGGRYHPQAQQERDRDRAVRNHHCRY